MVNRNHWKMTIHSYNGEECAGRGDGICVHKL